MKLIFVSNYFNHHQQPMSDRLNELCHECGGNYTFVQTEGMAEERVRMGWGEVYQKKTYLANYWENPHYYQRLIDQADAVIFGGTDDESYIQFRLRSRRPVWRYSERLYKNGRYRFISPRGLKQKFLDHTRYGAGRVYLLCAGAYVAGDFRLVLSYPGKKYKFGYFPVCKQYNIDVLMAEKGQRQSGVPTLFWAARMIDWKHPEVPIQLAAALKRNGYEFYLKMAGGGELESAMRELAQSLQVDDRVFFLGNQNPNVIRKHMEQSDIYLATSDYGEGWGAVLNEAMNSACAVVANKAMGAGPYLIQNGQNGFLYRNGHEEELLRYTQQLLKEPELREQIGRRAYATVFELWNSNVAAERVFACIQAELQGEKNPQYDSGPMSRA